VEGGGLLSIAAQGSSCYAPDMTRRRREIKGEVGTSISASGPLELAMSGSMPTCYNGDET
jgi:hypothetical protein